GGTGAILPANHTFVGGDAGVYTATNGVTLKQAGSRTVTATDTFARERKGVEKGKGDPDGATQLSVSGVSELTAGTAHAATGAEVGMRDRVVTGVQACALSIGGGTGAILPANHTFVGGDAGVYTATNGVTLKQAGSRTVTATDTFA